MTDASPTPPSSDPLPPARGGSGNGTSDRIRDAAALAAPDHQAPPDARVAELQRWAWIVLLLDAIEQAGLAPIASPDLHAAVYLANVLAPVYDLPVPNGTVYKYQRGPFYPDLQWDVDRLVVAGIVGMRDYQAVRDQFGAWFTASYVLPAAASALRDRILACPRWARVHEYLVELAAAIGSVPPDLVPAAAAVDATYADRAVPDGDLLDFADWDDRNYSSRAARAFSRFVPRGVRLSAREQLHLYVRYLRRAADAARESAREPEAVSEAPA